MSCYGNRSVSEFKAYLAQLIAWKRPRLPAPEERDILDALIHAQSGDDGFSEDEIIHHCIFMLNAGRDTTTSLLTNGVDLLLRFPDERARLIADPSLLRTAIDSRSQRMKLLLPCGASQSSSSMTLYLIR